MGLAATGEPRLVERLGRLVRVADDGSFLQDAGVGHAVEEGPPGQAEPAQARGPLHVAAQVHQGPLHQALQAGRDLLVNLVEVGARLLGLTRLMDADFRFYAHQVDGEFDVPYNQEDAVTMWALKPGYRDPQIRINSLGFRGPRPVARRVARVSRAQYGQNLARMVQLARGQGRRLVQHRWRG